MLILVGLDLGTSSVKSVVIHHAGSLVGFGQELYDIDIPKKSYAEQHPKMWWDATKRAIQSSLVNSELRSERIKSIGLSGQMHGLVLLDRSGNPLRPSIIWSDQRTQKIKMDLQEKFSQEQIGNMIQNPISTGFLLLSLLWVRENEPHIFDRIWKVMLPKDYIRFCLTGEVGVDHTDAAGTLLYDNHRREWSLELLKELRMDQTILPEIKNSWEVAGEITEKAAAETGLATGTIVVFGGADQPMQALGNGVIRSDTASITIGTGGQLLLPMNSPHYDKKLRVHTFSHVLPETWYLLGATLSAGLSLKWLSEILDISSYRDLDMIANESPVGSDHLLFLPYLVGERTPHMDPNAKGVFMGLTLKHNRSHMIRSVLEGVSYSFRDGLEIFKSMGMGFNRLIASGGGAKSKLWLQIIADVVNHPIYQSNIHEPACVGASMMAGIGAGIYRDIDEAIMNLTSISSTPMVPNPDHQEIYTSIYDLYKETYACNKRLFTRLNE